LSLYCDYAFDGGDDTCKTFLGQGETCNPKLFGTDCARDLHCDAATATCVWDLALCQ
jgi:hypothetical protein